MCFSAWHLQLQLWKVTKYQRKGSEWAGGKKTFFFLNDNIRRIVQFAVDTRGRRESPCSVPLLCLPLCPPHARRKDAGSEHRLHGTCPPPRPRWISPMVRLQCGSPTLIPRSGRLGSWGTRKCFPILPAVELRDAYRRSEPGSRWRLQGSPRILLELRSGLFPGRGTSERWVRDGQ